jgi:hypothetical protein
MAAAACIFNLFGILLRVFFCYDGLHPLVLSPQLPTNPSVPGG